MQVLTNRKNGKISAATTHHNSTRGQAGNSSFSGTRLETTRQRFLKRLLYALSAWAA